MPRELQKYCKRGHERTPDTVDKNGACKLCAKMRSPESWKRYKERNREDINNKQRIKRLENIDLERKKSRKYYEEVIKPRRAAAKKTEEAQVRFCKRGHEQNSENYVKGRGCKICSRLMAQARNNTPEGRAKRQEIEKRFRESGKKAAAAKKNWEAKKDDPVEKAKRAEYRKSKKADRVEYLRQWREQHPEQYRESSRRNAQKAVAEIRAHYAQATLGIKRSDVKLPDEIIEVQRLRILLKREMRHASNKDCQ